MRQLVVFETISLDGYFAKLDGDLSWAHKQQTDPEWDEFVANNASGQGTLMFGRVTYEMMLSYWPTPQAAKDRPVVAENMNKRPKVVFSRTLGSSPWINTTVSDDVVGTVRRMKSESGDGMTVLGSGMIVSQLAKAGLIDEMQIVVAPVVLGEGKSLFAGAGQKDLKLARSRSFKNGNTFLVYEPTS
ncbi:MAG: dihydrofolate reductase family protein [Gemmatimonadaceae bacterium]